MKRGTMKRWLLLGTLALGVSGVVMGCRTEQPKTPISKYPQLPSKPVPEFMKGTIYELTELGGTEYYNASTWGLVVNLRGTGDTKAPLAVRQFVLNELAKLGFGASSYGLKHLTPEMALRDPKNAIVRVDGPIPPGARQGQLIDVLVSCQDGNDTTSLSHGYLYPVDLRIGGADTPNPKGQIQVMGRAQGDVMINPAYALNSTDGSAQARNSRRKGVIPAGGVVLFDRPLVLQVRNPQWRLTRMIEQRLDYRFQTVADKPKKNDLSKKGVAAAQDEGLIHLYVPNAYKGDWEHFARLVTHMYLDISPAFAAKKSQELAAEAVKPNAPLDDISYCLEGLGDGALPAIRPLLSHSSPDVVFAAARAAARLGDTAALNTLKDMALAENHPFQLEAIRVVAKLPRTGSVTDVLRRVLHSKQTLVRIEAYKALAQSADVSIYTRVIGAKKKEKFYLDLVQSDGPGIVYATRTGYPRIAIIGKLAQVDLPITFMGFDSTMSISDDGKLLKIYYRGSDSRNPVLVLSGNDLAEVVARLGGEGGYDATRLNFSYGDIIAILQGLSESKRLSSVVDGNRQPLSFVLQEVGSLEDAIYGAPAIAGTPGAGEEVGTAIPEFDPTVGDSGSTGIQSRPQ